MRRPKESIEGKPICVNCKHCIQRLFEYCDLHEDKWVEGNFINGFEQPLIPYDSCINYNSCGECKDFEPKLSIIEKIKKWLRK